VSTFPIYSGRVSFALMTDSQIESEKRKAHLRAGMEAHMGLLDGDGEHDEGSDHGVLPA